MDPLKDQFFNERIYKGITSSLKACFPSLEEEKFLEDLASGNEDRELMDRLRHTSVVLQSHLPKPYPEALEIILELGPHVRDFTGMVLPDFVQQFGLGHHDLSLKALHHLTRFSSSEFAIRPYLVQDFERTMKVVESWTQDDNEHVRRLASEGTRPRLPWSFQLDRVLNEPQVTGKIIHELRKDTSLYVKKSVGNHLNDQTKDHPTYVLDLLDGWDLSNKHSAWIAKRAVRTLVKEGHPRSFGLMGFEKKPSYQIANFKLKATEVKLGREQEFSFDLVSEVDRPQYLNVDYVVHYMKKNGSHSTKVFKLKELMLEGSSSFRKAQKFEDLSTRKHYPGIHKIQLLINGKPSEELSFELKA